MAVLAPPVQVVASGAPPFVQVASGAPPFVAVSGNAPPITIVASGAPPITLFNEDGSVWSAVIPGGAALLVGEANGFATDFTHAVDAERVAVKASSVTTSYAVDAFFANAGTSPKMVYDVAGTLGWSPHNLINQSKDSSVAPVTNAVTITANTTAGPLGDVTADTLAFAPGAYHYKEIIGLATIGVAYCGSVWLKAAAPVQIGLRMVDNGGANQVAIVNVTTAWQQFPISITALGNAIQVGLDIRTGVSGDDNLAKTVIAADWQINRGTTPTAYLPTTTAARFGLALDYDPVTHAAKGLLCEPAGTNLALQSAMGRAGFEWGSTGATVTGGQADPAGGSQALQVVVTTNTGNNVFQVVTTLAATVYTGSMWLKGTVGQQIFLTADGNGTAQQLVTFTGAWQRISHTITTLFTGVYFACETYNRGGGAHLPNVTFSVWGAQYETGAVATSYIPTLAATVTRAGDVITITPASINYSATAGSWWIDSTPLVVAANARLIGYTTGTYTPINMASATQFSLYDGVANIMTTVASTLGDHKVAAAFASGDRAITADGLAPTTSAAAGTTLLSPGATIGIGGYHTGTATPLYIRKVRYLPRRPSNAEMQTMTA